MNLHADSLEEHVITDRTRGELDAWLETVAELLNDPKVEDVKTALIEAMKNEFDRQLRAIKITIRGSRREETTEAFRDFATDTLDDILADQDWGALADRILVQAHSAEANDDNKEWIAF